MLKLFKSPVSTISPLAHKGDFSPIDVYQFGPHSAKEPYFFLLKSRADLDSTAYTYSAAALYRCERVGWMRISPSLKCSYNYDVLPFFLNSK